MVQDDRHNGGASQARSGSAGDIARDTDRRSGLSKATTGTAQQAPQEATALRSERNEQTGVVSAEAVQIAHEICRALQRDPHDARAAALRLVTLLAPAPAAEPEDVRGGLAPWQKRKVDHYVREHLQRRMPVQELASQISISAGHFYRAFRKTHGESPQRYIARLRLELAQELMRGTDEPLAQIALASGFADQSHLSRAFRRVLAETPSAWRRRNGSDLRIDAKAPRPSPRRLR